jgi:hypothetical protein
VDGFLVVDDSDGRVLAYVDDGAEALRLLGELELEDPALAGALCLVRFDERQGPLVGIGTSTRVRSLT